MHTRSCSIACLGALVLLTSCQQQCFDIDAATIERYRTRAAAQGVQLATASGPAEPAMRTWPTSQAADAAGPAAATQPRQADDLTLGMRKPERVVRLGLKQVLTKALENSLDIKVESYGPGISATDIVAAEAAFDAVVFLDTTYANLNNPVNTVLPTPTNLAAGQAAAAAQVEAGAAAGSPTAIALAAAALANPTLQLPDDRVSSVHVKDFSVVPGIRKRLPTGGVASASLNINRISSNPSFDRWDQVFDNDATLGLTQPLLRGAGLDVKRAEIYIARNNRDISLYAFRRRVIDTLSAVEQAYWNVYLARQSLAIQRLLLAQTSETLAFVEARLDVDALPSNVTQVRSAVANRRATVIRLAAEVKDAEDRLKNLLDDPDLPVEQDIAIIPTDTPLTVQVDMDPKREFWAAMENRSELQEARLGISNANIGRGVARNLLLPRLDLLLQWNLNGLNEDWTRTNKQIFQGDFQDYVVGLTFEFPLGNRAAEAGVRRTQLQLEQAVANYHNLATNVMTEVQIALREAQTSYEEIFATQAAVRAAEDNLTALVERRERLSPEFLQVRLDAQLTLALARRAFQFAVVNYNNAIVRLEQAKGTLLRYDRVELAPESCIPAR